MKTFVCGGVWTGPGDDVLPASRISVQGDRIARITHQSDLRSSLFVIPGFVDAHCHFLWSGLERLFIDLGQAVSALDLLEMISSEKDSEMTKSILNQIDSYILEYGKKNNYKYLFGVTDNGNILYADEADDITDIILEELNNKYEGN